MPDVLAPGSARPGTRLSPDELRELRNTFEMRGLMPREQARLLAHVDSLERELRELRELRLLTRSN